jgi:hypothetical protein
MFLKPRSFDNDLNSVDQLEKNLSTPYNNALTLLRNNRNNHSHFHY